MQRDMGNEVIVAIAAVGILAFAITFAIILSLSNTPEVTATATTAAHDTTESPVSTSIAGVATATIQAAIDTEQPVATSPDERASEIPGITVADTTEPEPTVSTARTESTDTPTSRPPTQTSSFTPSATITRTPTPVPPSHTPTRTPTKTPTPTPTLTRTPRPTETSGIRPTPTGTLTPEHFPILPGDCMQPQGWVTYAVHQGDTLLKIARAVGTSLFELQMANCLQDINNIFAGDVIYVPRLPNFPPVQMNPIPIPGDPTVVAPLYPEGCTDPNSLIMNLQPGQAISGVFSVIGTASHPDFWYYKLEVRPDFATVYNFYSSSDTPVTNGLLGEIDQSIFGTGIHWIKLTVLGKSSGATPCAIPVIFQ